MENTLVIIINRDIIIGTDQSNGGFCVLGHSNTSFAQYNIMRVMRPISLPACFGQQRYANRAHCAYGEDMTIRSWSKIPLNIIDDPTWVMLPDDIWRAKFTEFALNPKNVYYEDNRKEYISKIINLRKALFARDPHKCAYCGSCVNLEIDHIYPLARGGSNCLSNLQILCRKCNRRKWAKL